MKLANILFFAIGLCSCSAPHGNSPAAANPNGLVGTPSRCATERCDQAEIARYVQSALDACYGSWSIGQCATIDPTIEHCFARIDTFCPRLSIAPAFRRFIGGRRRDGSFVLTRLGRQRYIEDAATTAPAIYLPTGEWLLATAHVDPRTVKVELINGDRFAYAIARFAVDQAILQYISSGGSSGYGSGGYAAQLLILSSASSAVLFPLSGIR